MEKTLRYAICDFDQNRGQILDDNGSLKWHEGSLEQATDQVRNKTGVCALFFPADVPGKGYPLEPNVSRATFEDHPGIWGVCFYKSSSGYAFE